jgi:hypothetical protein
VGLRAALDLRAQRYRVERKEEKTQARKQKILLWAPRVPVTVEVVRVVVKVEQFSPWKI